jgi:hypothetical protein
VSYKTNDVVVNVSFFYKNRDLSKRALEHLSRTQNVINETQGQVSPNYLFALIIETRQIVMKGTRIFWLKTWNDLRDVCVIMDDMIHHLHGSMSTSAENLHFFFNHLQETKRFVDFNISNCISVFEEHLFM